MSERFLKSPGDPRKLLAYKKAEIIYLLTYRFCERFLRKGDRTIDQMAGGAVGQTKHYRGRRGCGDLERDEIKLINVARASLGELLEDYRDYLATRSLAVWEKESEKAVFVRKKSRNPEPTTRPSGSLWKPARTKSWPTSPSASFTSAATCWNGF